MSCVATELTASLLLLCCRFTILNAVLYTRPNDLVELVNTESRVMLLYCTREEAIHILNNARDLKITGENYVWVAAQSVIATGTPPTTFPVGMLGKDLVGQAWGGGWGVRPDTGRETHF